MSRAIVEIMGNKQSYISSDDLSGIDVNEALESAGFIFKPLDNTWLYTRTAMIQLLRNYEATSLTISYDLLQYIEYESRDDFAMRDAWVSYEFSRREDWLVQEPGQQNQLFIPSAFNVMNPWSDVYRLSQHDLSARKINGVYAMFVSLPLPRNEGSVLTPIYFGKSNDVLNTIKRYSKFAMKLLDPSSSKKLIEHALCNIEASRWKYMFAKTHYATEVERQIIYIMSSLPGVRLLNLSSINLSSKPNNRHGQAALDELINYFHCFYADIVPISRQSDI